MLTVTYFVNHIQRILTKSRLKNWREFLLANGSSSNFFPPSCNCGKILTIKHLLCGCSSFSFIAFETTTHMDMPKSPTEGNISLIYNFIKTEFVFENRAYSRSCSCSIFVFAFRLRISKKIIIIITKKYLTIPIKASYLGIAARISIDSNENSRTIKLENKIPFWKNVSFTFNLRGLRLFGLYMFSSMDGL